MISSAFIDRPRLAIVIAIVITLAGALAIAGIPVSQFPDIVPPQVQVTATYPGASAEVVETSVAQPLEAQMVGVDRMIYMDTPIRSFTLAIGLKNSSFARRLALTPFSLASLSRRTMGVSPMVSVIEL